MSHLFNNLSISIKMYIVPIVNLAFMIGIVIYAMTMFDGTIADLKQKVSESFNRVTEADQLLGHATEAHSDLYRLITIATSSAEESDYVHMIDDHKASIALTLSQVESLKEKSDFSRIAELEENIASYNEIITQVYDMASDAAMSSLFLGDAQRTFDNIQIILKELVSYEFSKKDEEFESADKRAYDAEMLFVLLAAIAVAISIVVSIVIARVITKPLSQISVGMSDLSTGSYNLDLPAADRADEIGDMVKAVNVFSDAMQESERLASEQQKESIEKEERVHRVASLVDESRGLAEEVNSNVSTIAASVHEMSGSSEEIRQQTQRSTNMVERAVDEGKNSEEAMNALSSGATKIGEVMAVINNIAEQTNLLALNASIEAARAGEAGRGFAVVADEVKKLATQTSDATSDIQEQIQSVQGSVGHAVNSMQNIRDAVHQIEEVTTSITSAIEEQNSTTHAISESMEQATQGVQGLSENINSIHETAVES